MKQTLGVLLFALGLLFGIAFAAVAVWGDLEAALFDSSGSGEERLSALTCPVLITRGEAGVITARFTNTGPRPVDRAVRFHASMGYVTLMREESLHVPIAPGASEQVRWPVEAADAAYGGLLILARVSTLRQSPLPAQTGSCGILVLDLPLGGGAIVTGAWLVLSLAGMLGGGWLWLSGNSPRGGRGGTLYVMVALGGAVVASMILGLLGLWTPGVLTLALILLLLITVLAQAMLTG